MRECSFHLSLISIPHKSGINTYSFNEIKLKHRFYPCPKEKKRNKCERQKDIIKKIFIYLIFNYSFIDSQTNQEHTLHLFLFHSIIL